MDDLGCRQRHALQQYLELLPVQGLFAATTIQPVFPTTLGMVEYRFHRSHVAAYAKVLKVPPKLRAQYPVLLHQVHVPVEPTPDPEGLRRLPDFLARRLRLITQYPFRDLAQ